MIDPSSVPFYGNTPDDTHCFQAGMKMVLGHFLPEREFAWEELDRLSAKKDGMSTWPEQMLISLRKMGFVVAMIEGFDGHAFIRSGAQYLRNTFGPEIAAWQIENSDLPQEQHLYQEAYDQGVDIQMRIPELSDLQTYQHKGYLVTANVNSHRLREEPGYSGHFVVILSVDDHEVVLHDPGPPPREAVHVPIDQFITAWADPDEKAKNFIGIKLETSPEEPR